MSRRQQQCEIYECDVCGRDFENGDGVVLHFEVGTGDSPSSWDDWVSWEQFDWCGSCGTQACSKCGHLFEEHENGDADCENDESGGPCECTYSWTPKAGVDHE